MNAQLNHRNVFADFCYAFAVIACAYVAAGLWFSAFVTPIKVNNLRYNPYRLRKEGQVLYYGFRKDEPPKPDRDKPDGAP